MQKMVSDENRTISTDLELQLIYFELELLVAIPDHT